MWIVLTIAAAVSWLPCGARAEGAKPDSAGAALWWGAAANLSRPLGGFDPPGDTPQLGFGAHLSIQAGHSPIGVRLEFGMTSSDVTVDSVAVELLPGFATFESVTAGNDLLWFLVGAHWDPRPHGTSLYAYTSLGMMNVDPKGVVGGGTTFRPEVPGLPPSSSVFAFEVGLGSRLVLGERFGLNAEVEYLHGTAADYVGPAGVEGSNPTHYASKNSPIGLFIVRLGFVRMMK